MAAPLPNIIERLQRLRDDTRALAESQNRVSSPKRGRWVQGAGRQPRGEGMAGKAMPRTRPSLPARAARERLARRQRPPQLHRGRSGAVEAAGARPHAMPRAFAPTRGQGALVTSASPSCALRRPVVPLPGLMTMMAWTMPLRWSPWASQSSATCSTFRRACRWRAGPSTAPWWVGGWVGGWVAGWVGDVKGAALVAHARLCACLCAPHTDRHVPQSTPAPPHPPHRRAAALAEHAGARRGRGQRPLQAGSQPNPPAVPGASARGHAAAPGLVPRAWRCCSAGSSSSSSRPRHHQPAAPLSQRPCTRLPAAPAPAARRFLLPADAAPHRRAGAALALSGVGRVGERAARGQQHEQEGAGGSADDVARAPPPADARPACTAAAPTAAAAPAGGAAA